MGAGAKGASVAKDGVELEKSIAEFKWEPQDIQLVDEDGNPISSADEPESGPEDELDLTDSA